MTRKSRREIARAIEGLRSDTRDVPEVRSEVVTVTSDMVDEDGTLAEDAVGVPDGATVVHESDAVIAWTGGMDCDSEKQTRD